MAEKKWPVWLRILAGLGLGIGLSLVYLGICGLLEWTEEVWEVLTRPYYIPRSF